MNEIINKHDLQGSFKQVARLAVSGTPEQRSGQSGGSHADIAMRLRNELRIATLNWATVEAFHATFEVYRDQLIAHTAWQPPMFAVRAVVRDVIVTLMRVTDGPGQKDDLETISRILKSFDGMKLGEIVEATGASEGDVAAGLEFLRERVPSVWGRNQPLPSNLELADMRAAFEPIRNNLIAHAKVYSSLDLRRNVKMTRDFLLLVSKLSDAVCMLCNVPRDDLEERWDASFAEAIHFWNVVAAGSEIPVI